MESGREMSSSADNTSNTLSQDVKEEQEEPEEIDMKLYKLMLHQREVKNSAKRRYNKRRYANDEAYREHHKQITASNAKKRYAEDEEYANKVREKQRVLMAARRAAAKTKKT